jgi:hypothetical protein
MRMVTIGERGFIGRHIARHALEVRAHPAPRSLKIVHAVVRLVLAAILNVVLKGTST